MKHVIGYALAPKILVEKKMKVCFMYRERPDHPQDSGWRFFTGLESDEYVNDSTNIDIYDVHTIAMIDPDIIPLLNSSIGYAFERSDVKSSFIKYRL